MFDNRPKVKSRRLNVLPDNPEEQETGKVVGPGRFPKWLHRTLPKGNLLWETQKIVDQQRLPTVCEEAKCPNLLECWSKKTATFLAMGNKCTRNCGFCDIDFSPKPQPLAEDEPARLAESVKQLGLKHVVITMVARDDLGDGGASHLVKIMTCVREVNPKVTIEILTSDFEGCEEALSLVLAAKPDVFNHNIETVKRLSPRVRHRATYERTLSVLKYIHENAVYTLVKSGLMVGLGESEPEVQETISDLYNAGCRIITIGQYLQANRHKLRVKEFIHPSQFDAYKAFGEALGVPHMYCGPFVRSSYNAAAIFERR